MNLALIGSVSSSQAVLDALIRSGVEITCVLGLDAALADRVSDYRDLRPLAEQAGIPFRAFTKVDAPEVAAFLEQHRPDMLWVIGLSQLVPRPLVELAPQGGVGFHPTPLPKGRGRAPVAWTILLDQPAAASLFYLADEPDAGDIIMQRPVPVLPDDYSEDLIARTNQVLAAMVCELAPRIISGDVPRTPQDHSQATHYPKRTPDDGLIRWDRPADQIYKLIRAAGRPYPGAFAYVRGEKIIVWRGRPASPDAVPKPGQAGPGVVLATDRDAGALVATGEGAIWLTEVQLAAQAPAGSLLGVGEVLTSVPDSPG